MKIEDSPKDLAKHAREHVNAMFDEWFQHAKPIIELIVCDSAKMGHTVTYVTFQVGDNDQVFKELIKLNPILIPSHLVSDYTSRLRDIIPSFKECERTSTTEITFVFSFDEDSQNQ